MCIEVWFYKMKAQATNLIMFIIYNDGKNFYA